MHYAAIALCTGAFVVACGASDSREGVAQTEQRDRWTPDEDPAYLVPGMSTQLVDNIKPDDVGKSFGVDDARVPYPDSYWPFNENGIDTKWNGEEPSPLDKYFAAVNPAAAAAAKAWENKFHGKAVPNVASWWGHCNGWVASAMANAPILHPVLAKSNGAGGVAACTAGEAGCVKLEIGDINALEAEAWQDASAALIGARCDKKPADIQRDAYGRIVRDGSGCKGLNAGALLVVLSQRLRVQKEPLAIDAQNSYNTEQIWNQPAYRYTVHRFEALTEPVATNLVAYGKREGDKTKYEWDDYARGFVFVDIGIHWVSEDGPNSTVVSGTQSTSETRFVAVIELTGAPTDPAARILGGEYLQDASAGADRLKVPPFVWITLGSGPEYLDPRYATMNTHNPFVRPSVVKQLVALGQQHQ